AALCGREGTRAGVRDGLAEGVWEEHPPKGWVNPLQTYVFHLRQALEPGQPPGAARGVLVTSGRGYLLRVSREDLDAARFQDGFTAGRAALEAGRRAPAGPTLGRAAGWWGGGGRGRARRLRPAPPAAAAAGGGAGGAAAGRGGGADRRGPGAGPPRRADCRTGAAGWRASATGAAARAADAGAVPLRPAGGGARHLPAGPRATRRRTRYRPGGAAAAPARIRSRSGPGAGLERWPPGSGRTSSARRAGSCPGAGITWWAVHGQRGARLGATARPPLACNWFGAGGRRGGGHCRGGPAMGGRAYQPAR